MATMIRLLLLVAVTVSQVAADEGTDTTPAFCSSVPAACTCSALGSSSGSLDCSASVEAVEALGYTVIEEASVDFTACFDLCSNPVEIYFDIAGTSLELTGSGAERYAVPNLGYSKTMTIGETDYTVAFGFFVDATWSIGGTRASLDLKLVFVFTAPGGEALPLALSSVLGTEKEVYSWSRAYDVPTSCETRDGQCGSALDLATSTTGAAFAYAAPFALGATLLL